MFVYIIVIIYLHLFIMILKLIFIVISHLCGWSVASLHNQSETRSDEGFGWWEVMC